MNNSARLHRILAWLQIFVGIGAIPAGLMMLLNPVNPSFFPPEWLANTPFDDFLIPGLLLFSVNGLANLAAGYLSWKQRPATALIAILLGGFLIGWIGAQVYWFESVHWLHVIYGSLGMIELYLGVRLWLAQANPKAAIR